MEAAVSQVPGAEKAAASSDGRSSTSEAGPAKRNVHMVTVMES